MDTLTEWLNFKIKTYLEQADKGDRQGLETLFKHFCFLDKSVTPDLAAAKPLTPKEIGYLSPRVPRPVYAERPVTTEAEAQMPRPETGEIKKHETAEAMLPDGAWVKRTICPFTLPDGTFDVETKKLVPLEVAVGTRFMVKGESFIFAGVVKDESSPYHGKPIAQLASGEKLYKIFNAEQVDMGITEEFKNVFKRELEDMEKEVEDFCRFEAEDNNRKTKI